MITNYTRKRLSAYLSEADTLVCADIMYTGDTENANRTAEKLLRVGRGALVSSQLKGFKFTADDLNNTLNLVKKEFANLHMETVGAVMGKSTPENIRNFINDTIGDTPLRNVFRTVTFGECAVNSHTMNICKEMMKCMNFDPEIREHYEKLYRWYRLQDIYKEVQILGNKPFRKADRVKPRLTVLNGIQLNWEQVPGFVREGFIYYATRDENLDYYLLCPQMFQEQMMLAMFAGFLRKDERDRRGKLTSRAFTSDTYKRMGSSKKLVTSAIELQQKQTVGYLFKELTPEIENKLIPDIFTVMPRTCNGAGGTDYMRTIYQTSELRGLQGGGTDNIGSIFSTVYSVLVEGLMGLWANELNNSIMWAKQRVPTMVCDILLANSKLILIGMEKTVTPHTVFGMNSTMLRKLKPVEFDVLVENDVTKAY